MDVKSPWFLDWLLMLLCFAKCKVVTVHSLRKLSIFGGKGPKREIIPLPYVANIPACGMRWSTWKERRRSGVLLGSSSIICSENCKMLYVFKTWRLLWETSVWVHAHLHFLYPQIHGSSIRMLFMMIPAISHTSLSNIVLKEINLIKQLVEQLIDCCVGLNQASH